MFREEEWNRSIYFEDTTQHIIIFIMLSHFEKLFGGKPKNKTGRQVVAQKLQTAQKTNILSLTEHGLVSGIFYWSGSVMFSLYSKSHVLCLYVAIFIGGNSWASIPVSCSLYYCMVISNCLGANSIYVFLIPLHSTGSQLFVHWTYQRIKYKILEGFHN